MVEPSIGGSEAAEAVLESELATIVCTEGTLDWSGGKADNDCNTLKPDRENPQGLRPDSVGGDDDSSTLGSCSDRCQDLGQAASTEGSGGTRAEDEQGERAADFYCAAAPAGFGPNAMFKQGTFVTARVLTEVWT